MRVIFVLLACLAAAPLMAQDPDEAQKEFIPHKYAKAAAHAVSHGEISHMKKLLDAGLPADAPLYVSGPDGSPGWTGLHLCCIHNQPAMMAFLLQEGAHRAKRDLNGDRPIDFAVEKGQEALCHMLAIPETKERLVDGFPKGMLSELFERFKGERSPDKKLTFVAFNNGEPSEKMMAFLAVFGDKLRPISLKKDDPESLAARYLDKKTNQPATLVELNISPPKDGKYAWSLRVSTGPFLAGGGQRGLISREYGWWVITKVVGWDE